MKKRRKHTHSWLLRHKNYTVGRTTYAQMLENTVFRQIEKSKQNNDAEISGQS